MNTKKTHVGNGGTALLRNRHVGITGDPRPSRQDPDTGEVPDAPACSAVRALPQEGGTEQRSSQRGEAHRPAPTHPLSHWYSTTIAARAAA